MESEAAGDARHETETERLDRNWNELLQELRVTQTGVQILAGFLLTLPFQQRFADLDERSADRIPRGLASSVRRHGLLVAPVSAHRVLFRRRAKRELVRFADKAAQAGLVALAASIVTARSSSSTSSWAGARASRPPGSPGALPRQLARPAPRGPHAVSATRATVTDAPGPWTLWRAGRRHDDEGMDTQAGPGRR